MTLLEEIKKIFQVNGALRYGCEAGEYALEQTAQLAERPGKKSQVANTDPALNGF